MITIIDYGMGNLRSVQKGLERAGSPAQVSSDPDEIARSDKLVLPGVGAIRDAMSDLRQRGLIEPIAEAITAGKPFLGICLGMQLLFDTSYEGGEHRGLGILPGKVVRFDLPLPLKVPHMGWNQLEVRRPCPLLDQIADQAHVYFVHSMYVVPDDPAVIAAETDYGQPFCSMVCRDNLMATQFHPEKSQAVGLQMLRNFGRM